MLYGLFAYWCTVLVLCLVWFGALTLSRSKLSSAPAQVTHRIVQYNTKIVGTYLEVKYNRDCTNAMCPSVGDDAHPFFLFPGPSLCPHFIGCGLCFLVEGFMLSRMLTFVMGITSMLL